MLYYSYNDAIIGFLIGLLGALCFLSSWDGRFVFDDEEAIVNNKDLKPETPLTDIFKHDFWGTNITHNSSHKSYRPLTILSFRFHVWTNNGRLDTVHFHIGNIILHFVVTSLSYPLFGKLFSIQRLWGSKALMSSVLFAVHPIHTEAVAGIVGRADLLCAILSFISFFVYCKATSTPSFVITYWLTWLTVCSAGLAMLCKEQGITIIGVCSAYDILVAQKLHPLDIFPLKRASFKDSIYYILFKNLPLKKKCSDKPELEKQCRFIIRHGVLLIGTCSLIYFRCWIMNFTSPRFRKTDNPQSFIESFFLRVTNYQYIYAINGWLLICPEWLCFDWSMGCVPLIEDFLTDPRLLGVLAFWLILTALIFHCLLHSGHLIREVLMALSFIIITFSLASNLLITVGFVIAERVTYMPSVGFCMLVVIGVQQLIKYFKTNIFYIFFIFLLVVNILRCHQRSSDWRTERDLFSSALKVCPLNAKVHYNYAKTVNNMSVAINHYREAIRLNSEYEQAMNNLANVLRDHGNISESEELLKRAISIRPDFAAAWMNLGIVLAAMDKYDEALQSYNKALTFRKKYPDCYYNLGNLFVSKEMYNEAYTAWIHATKLKPAHSTAWNNLIVMLDSLGDLDKALSLATQALQILPEDPALHFNLANTLGKKGVYEEAEQHFLTAIKLKPNQHLYHTNLGVLYHRWKKYDKARIEYSKALQINPDVKNVKQNLEVVENILKKINGI